MRKKQPWEEAVSVSVKGQVFSAKFTLKSIMEVLEETEILRIRRKWKWEEVYLFINECTNVLVYFEKEMEVLSK